MNDEDLHTHLQSLSGVRMKAPERLARRIESNLPGASPIDRIFDWLCAAIWRGAVAAVLPIAIGLSVGLVGGYEDSTERSIWLSSESLVFADNLDAYDYEI